MKKVRFGKGSALCLFAVVFLLVSLYAGFSLMKAYAGTESVSAVLYVGGKNASDDNDGTTEEKAVETLAKAYALVPKNNVKTYIVVCGKVTVNAGSGNRTILEKSDNHYYFTPHTGEVVITSKYGDDNFVDSAGLTFAKRWYLVGNTTFENIRVLGTGQYIYANYFSLTLGEGVTGEKLATRIILGTTSSINGTTSPKMPISISDVNFTMKSGNVDILYGGGYGYQGGSGKNNSVTINISGGTVTELYGSGYNKTEYAHHKSIAVNVTGGTVTNLYGAHADATVYEDISINVSGGTVGTLYGASNVDNASDEKSTPEIKGDIIVTVSGGTVDSLNAVEEGANVSGVKILNNPQASVLENASGFNALGLTNSSLTIAEKPEALWDKLTQLHMTDDSKLVLGFTPTKKIDVYLTKSGDEWNTDAVLIEGPADTENLFYLQNPMDYQLKYDGTAASWTLQKASLEIGESGTAGVVMDLDLGLPEGKFTPILDPDADAYEVFLQKVEDLGAAKTEVKVINPVEVQGEVELHVSPSGDDNNNGSLYAPFYSITKALSYVEALGEAGVKGIVIYLHEGTYVVSEALTLDVTHSGKNGIPVILSAYPGEEVVVSGGVDIAGDKFTKVTDEAVLNRLQSSVKDHIVVVDLKALKISEFGSIASGRFGGPGFSVSMNGEPLTLSRYPDVTTIPLTEVTNAGTKDGSSYTGVEYVMQDMRPESWQNDGNIWRYGNLGGEWYMVHSRVAKIDSESNTITLDAGDTRAASGEDGYAHYYYNILEELNVPGEYYIDSKTGKLYLYPIADMSTATVSYVAKDNAIIKLQGTENVVLNGLIIEDSTGYGIYLDDCKNTLVQNCVIRRVGTGAKIDGKNSGIIYSNISEIADRPINIGEAIDTYNYDDVQHNFVQNCYIYNTGMTGVSNTAIYVDGIQNVLSHNLIQGTYSVSIYLQGAAECIIEYNEIVGGPNGTYDYGSIYCSGSARTGNHIRYNYIHDTARFSTKSSPHSIYLDEGTRGYFVYGNIMTNVQDGVFVHFGSDNVIVDNIVMSTREGCSSKPIHGNDKMAGLTIAERFDRSSTWEKMYGVWASYDEEERAVFKQRYPSFAKLYETVEEAIIAADGSTDTGVGLFTSEGNYAKNNILVYAEGIQFEGRDTHVIVDNAFPKEDPFVDAANHDFALKDGVDLGFTYQAVDMARVGIVGREKEGIGAFSQYAPADEWDEVDPYSVLLKWTLAGGADTYRVTIATNEALTENVREFIVEDNFCYFERDEYFSFDNTYYWYVEANTTAKSRVNTPVNGSVLSFKTMTEDLYFTYNKADLEELEETIEEAESYAAQMKEIAEGGPYSAGSREALQNAIAQAKAVLAAGERQDQLAVNASVDELNNSIMQAMVSREIQYITFDDLVATDWADIADGRVSSSVTGEELLLTVSKKRAESVYSEGLGIRDILCFKYKLDEMKKWHGFALAQVNKSKFITEGTDGYFICINPTQVELQKYQGGTKVCQVNVLIDSSVFDGGDYYNIEVGAINYADGTVGIHFKINDKVIFDPTVHLDTETDETLVGSPILGASGFGVIVNPSNGTTYIMKSTADYTALDEEIAKEPENGEQVYTEGSWAAYQLLLEEAAAISRDLIAPYQEEIDELTAQLQAARESLVVETTTTEAEETTTTEAEETTTTEAEETTTTEAEETTTTEAEETTTTEAEETTTTEAEETTTTEAEETTTTEAEETTTTEAEETTTTEEEVESPDTGDHGGLLIWTVLLMISASICGFVINKKSFAK